MMDGMRAAGTWLRRLVLLGCVGALVLLAAQVYAGRYEAHPILSGSMSPGFAVGGVVVAKRVPVSSLAERDVIIFHKPTSPDELVVHRIVGLTTEDGATVIETKGDNNATKDPWQVSLRGGVAYKATHTIPFVGYAALWLHDPATRRYAAFVAAAVLLLAAVIVLMRKERPTKPAAEAATPAEVPAEAGAQAEPAVGAGVRTSAVGAGNRTEA
jgi:signal peptidase